MQAIERLWTRVQMLVGRGRIQTVKDDGPVQFVQVKLSELETIDKLPSLLNYGLAHNPPAETDAIVLFIAGDRSAGVVIATGNQTYRLKSLAPGEVALYDDQGQKITLKRGGIEIDGGGLPVTVTNSPSVTLDTPAAIATGTVDATGTVNTAAVYKVDGTQVVGPQLPAIPDPTGGGTIDAQARATEALILAAMRAHGLIAP